jgi:hypothetical protein
MHIRWVEFAHGIGMIHLNWWRQTDSVGTTVLEIVAAATYRLALGGLLTVKLSIPQQTYP